VWLKFHPALGVLALAGFSLIGNSPAARAQEQTEVLMPEQSAAKAKELIQKAVQALGGTDYLAVRDATCEGREGSFGHSGELMGYEKFIDYEKLPDKDRSENLPKRNIIEVKSGDKGWVLDRGGVSDADQVSVASFQEELKVDIDNVLRDRWIRCAIQFPRHRTGINRGVGAFGFACAAVDAIAGDDSRHRRFLTPGKPTSADESACSNCINRNFPSQSTPGAVGGLRGF